MTKTRLLFLLVPFLLILGTLSAQKKQLKVIAYYAGPPQTLDSFSVEKLSELIFCFVHLKGNQAHISNARDTAILQKMISLKSRNPKLKIIISLGGWGGCFSCSDVFSSKRNRKAFAESVKGLIKNFGADGIDLDWEYPAIAGFPSHKYMPEDKENFTSLIKQLRKKLGKRSVITFASGGFTNYVDESIEWKKVMRKVNTVHVMSYDLTDGYSTTTGHHTPLYSTQKQKESANNTITEMIAHGVPPNKIAIGAAFYAKVWQDVPDTTNGLYQGGKYKMGISYKNFDNRLSPDSGFVYHWDSVAQAPFVYNPSQKIFATFDDKKSVELKTRYAIDKRLNGIMFWQLGDDKFTNGLLDEIDKVKKDYE